MNGQQAIERLMPILRCGTCTQALKFEQVPQPQNKSTRLLSDGIFGILHCNCGARPVIDAIPVMLPLSSRLSVHTIGTTRTVSMGPTLDELVAEIRAGRGLDALMSCLYTSYRPPPLRVLNRLMGRKLWDSKLGERMCRFLLRRRQLRLMDEKKHHNARAWLELLHGADSGAPLGDAFPYFYHRFAQPRWLAALASTSLLPNVDRPILDLACGVGHLAHNLTSRRGPGTVVGADFNFAGVWIARRFVAPEAMFVIADARERLPFADGSFGAAVCSDAFHLLPNQSKVLAELRRCAPTGPRLFTRVGNALLGPREGSESSPDGYAAMMGPGSVLWGEHELVDCYLNRELPPVRTMPNLKALRSEKWLTVMDPPSNYVPPLPEPGEQWPHGAGVLRVNTLYSVARTKDGVAELRLRMPSTWYAVENGALLEYTPMRVELPAVEFDALSQRSHRDAEALLKSFVAIGVPAAYG